MTDAQKYIHTNLIIGSVIVGRVSSRPAQSQCCNEIVP